MMTLYPLLLVMFVCLALLGLGFWVSGLLLHPRRHPVTHTPQEYGLEYENASFPSKDGLSLRGWWIPASYGRAGAPHGGLAPVVILLHPMFGNRTGSPADRHHWSQMCQGKADLLKTAQGFHCASYAVLLFDFRNHGESQAGLSAGGLNEDQDVAGAVDYVFRRMAAETPDEAPQVGIVGFGMGASAAVSAVGRERGGREVIRVFSADNEGATGLVEFPPANVKMLSFLVAIEPGSLRTWLHDQIRQVFPPLSLLLVPLVDRFCQWRGGYPLDEALLVKLARNVSVPVLYVHACARPGDRRSEVQRLYEVTPGPKQMWPIEGLCGRIGTYGHVADHLEQILAFAEQHVSR